MLHNMSHIGYRLILLLLLIMIGFIQLRTTIGLDINAPAFSAKRLRNELSGSDGTLCEHFRTKSRSSIRRCILQFPDEPTHRN
jgi:hypothetical protein